MKTSELTGAALDWAVGMCEWNREEGDWGGTYRAAYSTDWAQGGPIIEREGISLGAHLDGEEWLARDYWGMSEQSAPTPLIAAMRCYVASKLGEEVQIPNELEN